MVGGPIDVGELLTPTIGYQITFGTVHGYLEAYGAGTEGVTIEYEVATAPDAPALLNVDVPPHRVSESARHLHEGHADAGSCRRASTSCARSCRPRARAIKTLTRGFEIAAPKVLMTSADGLGGETSVDAELFLPVDDAVMKPAVPAARPRSRTETLAPFRERVAPAVHGGVRSGRRRISAPASTRRPN